MLPRRELANLRRSGALITSSVDCCRVGYMWGGPAGPAGPAPPLPDRAGEQAGERQLARVSDDHGLLRPAL